MKLNKIELKDIHGSVINWDNFSGKSLLFVNVASKCGFTPQYEQLQELYTYHSDRLEIIALPCNDFGGQEPGTAEEIESFCKLNYGVSFTISEKINILNEAHPIIQYLCKADGRDIEIQWNFFKFIVKDGKYIAHFNSTTSPLDEALMELI